MLFCPHIFRHLKTVEIASRALLSRPHTYSHPHSIFIPVSVRLKGSTPRPMIVWTFVVLIDVYRAPLYTTNPVSLSVTASATITDLFSS